MSLPHALDVITEYGVRLLDGQVCPAVDRVELYRFAGRHRPVMYRQVVRQANGSIGRRNLVQIGPWRRLDPASGL